MSRKTQLKKMEELLIQRRDALKLAVKGDNSLLDKFSQQSGGDVVDFASDSSTNELGSQLAEVRGNELQRADQAIQRIQDGSYGECKACRKNIPLNRLQALPYTPLCINCQRAAEEAGVNPNTVVDWSQIIDQDFSSSDMDIHFS